MAIQFVNGFQCKDCTDVANAKKHIDPAHPKDGPYGVNKDPADALQRPGAVLYGGSLAALDTVQGVDGRSALKVDPTRSAAGTLLDQSV